MSDELLALVVCAPAGLVLLGLYLRDVVRLWRLWRHGIRTLGVVVDHKVNDQKWEPVIEFADGHGRLVRSTPVVRVDEQMKMGRELPVLYMADRPGTMFFHSWPRMAWHLLSNFLIPVGGLGFLAGAVFAAMDLAK